MIILAARGYSNREIANALYLSINTVKTHLHRVSVRHRVTGRAGVVGLAFALDLLTASDILDERAQDSLPDGAEFLP